MPVSSTLALSLLACSVAHAAEITGWVVSMADGDTTILDSGHEQHRVRLAGIDAPEKQQRFGNAAKRNLSEMVAGRTVRVEFVKFDRYQR